MKAAYPVIFTQTKENVLVEVPDLDILTEGIDMVDAIDMARDAIGIHGIALEDRGLEIPSRSDLEKIDVKKGTFAKDGKGYISLVDIDFTEYRRKTDNKAVRRNVTLPNWLNQRAESSGINVSKVLQNALMDELRIQK